MKANGDLGWSRRRAIPVAVLVAAAALALPAMATERPNDVSIGSWVKEALRDDPRVDASSIDATVEDGIVTLRGTVRDLAAKRFADREAKKLAGVRGVIDELSVRPADRPDPAIARDILARLRSSPDLRSRALEVDVNDGVAALRGTVGSWSEKQQAELLATEVRSVRDVRNDLTLHYEKSRSDDAIQRDAAAAIARDAYLAGLPITVKVHQGEVTLTGSVGNAYQRERAADAAWVANVDDVKNDLEVDWWEQRGVRKAVPLPSDEEIAESVRAVLYQDLGIADPFAIDVDASSGEVTLRGTVSSYDQKLRAERDSKDVVGVGWVGNHLVVPPSSRSDAAIRDELLARLDEDYLMHGQDLGVLVRNGIVTLSGRASSDRERSQAVRVAARVPGVVEVVDHVRVDWKPRLTDAELETRIQDRLWQDAETREVADRVSVRVEDGVARLKGDVDDWDERLEAARIAAVTDGVRWVDNQITVEGVDYAWDEWYLPGEGSYAWYALPPR